jgi:hypothetical protein
MHFLELLISELEVHMRILIILAFLMPTTVLACNSTFDCKLGSKCLKTGSTSVGICVDGNNSGNTYDQNLYKRNPIKDDRSRGKSCNHNFQCGIGNNCIKSGGSFNGVCSQ